MISVREGISHRDHLLVMKSVSNIYWQRVEPGRCERAENMTEKMEKDYFEKARVF